jgi:CRISPR-associated protein Cas1
MIKRTLHFSNPAHLSVHLNQLVVELKDAIRTTKTIPIEDIGLVVLEHPQITLTSILLEKLMDQKVALISCNSKYMPSGMHLPFDSNTEQTARMRTQMEATIPLKKQLWQQTIKAKIQNQANVLMRLGENNERLLYLKEKVLSGDSKNCEAQAASFYWSKLYGNEFVRSRIRETPNAQLNYGYAILRSLMARALASSGMHPSFGIFHKNKYNAFCLADDIMEPYRPFIDWEVLKLLKPKSDADFEFEEDDASALTREQKIVLLQLPQLDMNLLELKRPLYHAVSMTTAGLYKCFAGESRKIPYPIFE